MADLLTCKNGIDPVTKTTKKSTAVDVKSAKNAEAEDDDERKLFIGGLGQDLSENDLRDYIKTFGEIASCVIKTDLETGVSRGFGFVVFKDLTTLNEALNAESHKLKGHVLDVKKANPKKKIEVLKIFVGGLNPDTSEDELREYFAKYGTIVDMDRPVTYEKKRRGFCFIKYDNEKSVTDAINDRFHTIGGREVEVKKCFPKPDYNRMYMYGGYGGQYYGYNRGSGRGRRGRGYGGYGNRGYGYDNYGYNNYGGYGAYHDYYGNYYDDGYYDGYGS